jgi:hypothetical protein
MKEEFKIPMIVKIPPLRRIANIQNGVWALCFKGSAIFPSRWSPL